MVDFVGTSGEDFFTGSDGRDTASGGAGNDRLTGNGDVDILSGDAGADVIDGGDGDDTLFSGSRSTSLALPYYNDQSSVITITLDTGRETDTINGGAGSDRIVAGFGDNVDGGTGGPYGDYLYISFQGAQSGVVFDFGLATQVIGGGTITNFESLRLRTQSGCG